MRSLLWLTLGTTVRFARQTRIARAIFWPIGILVGTFFVTLATFSLFQPSNVVGVVSGAPIQELHDAGIKTIQVASIETSVRTRVVDVATDGERIYTTTNGRLLRQVEFVVRKSHPTSWQITPPGALPKGEGRQVVLLLVLIYCLYGLVFTLGSTVRDRDTGCLSAELSLGISNWQPGFARLVASLLLLCTGLCMSISLLSAILFIPDPWSLLAHGSAAVVFATSLGLASGALSTQETGFSAAFSWATGLLTAFFALSALLPGEFLPILSLRSDGSPILPLSLSALFAGLSVYFFGYRATRW